MKRCITTFITDIQRRVVSKQVLSSLSIVTYIEKLVKKQKIQLRIAISQP